MLDEARAVGAEFNRIAGENCLYFETGQVLRSPLALISALTGDDGSAKLRAGASLRSVYRQHRGRLYW